MLQSKLSKIKYTILIILSVLFVALMICSCDATDDVASKEYILCYVAENGGYISGDSQQTVTENSDGFAVEAIANEGYEFVEWSDGVTTAERIEKSVKAEKTVTAKFKKAAYTVNYVTDGNGIISGEAKQVIEFGGSATTVTVIASDGYRFVEWSDGITTAERTDTNVTANKTVTAKFEKISYAVTYTTDGNGSIEGDADQIIKFGENAITVTAVSNEGYEFVQWSDGKKEPTRTDLEIKADLMIEAQFTKLKYIDVLYGINSGGIVYNVSTGERIFATSIPYGTDGPIVKAVADEGYEFVGWDDGVETAERQDLNITERFLVRAQFRFIGHLYTADYKIYKSGGTIQGKAHQEVRSPAALEEVTAVPDEGYMFSCWSDNNTEATRKDDKEKSFEFYAYFEPIQKKFRYDYGIASGTPTATEITLNRDTIQTVEFIIPQLEGCSFGGWYADRDYKIKVANENGRYMYGYAGFSLESDTLYAKWTKENENEDVPVYKVLLVFVNETDGIFYSYKKKQDYEIHFEMTAMDRAMCFAVAGRFEELLNEWFEGKVKFEVDSYYTLMPVGEEGCHKDGERFGGTSCWISAEYIPEMFRLNRLYHSVLTTYSMDDYNSKFRNFSGIAGAKFGGIPFEKFYINDPTLGRDSQQAVLEGFCFRGDITDMSVYDRNAMQNIGTYLHEFTHTCECNYLIGEILEFHEVISYYMDIYRDMFTSIKAIKYYLLGKSEYYDGVTGGIPTEYWWHLRDPVVGYGTRPLDGDFYGGGTIVVLSREESKISKSRVPYGSDVIVEAVPKEGYRFVRWSDGITTAVRHDGKIISNLDVLAIFEKII